MQLPEIASTILIGSQTMQLKPGKSSGNLREFSPWESNACGWFLGPTEGSLRHWVANRNNAFESSRQHHETPQAPASFCLQ